MGGLVLEFLENQCWSNWGCLKLSKHSEENTHLTMLIRNKTYFQHLSTSFNYLPKYFNIFQNQCLLLVVLIPLLFSATNWNMKAHPRSETLAHHQVSSPAACLQCTGPDSARTPAPVVELGARDPQCKERSQTGHRSCWSNFVEWLQGQKSDDFIILHECAYIYIHIILCIYIYKHTLHIYIYIHYIYIYIHTLYIYIHYIYIHYIYIYIINTIYTHTHYIYINTIYKH